MEIPLSRPDITQAERDAVNAVMQTWNLSLGPKQPPQAEAHVCEERAKLHGSMVHDLARRLGQHPRHLHGAGRE